MTTEVGATTGADTTAGAALVPARPGRVIETAPFVLLVLLLAVVLKYSALTLTNQDTWFHLTLGDHFRGDWSLAHPGALTPFATSQWVPTQWSTEVLASLVEHWFGLPGVAWLFGAFYLLLVLTAYGVCRARSGALPATVVTALLVFAAAPALSARPQVLSLILVAVTVHAWLRTWDDGRLRWWLVPLTWVWATAHGLWSAGVLLGLVCCVGLLLDRRVGGRRAVLAFAVPLLSLAATALTPVGPRLLAAQLAVSARTSLIAEWGPTSFRTVPALVAAAMVAWLAVLWARRGGTSWTHLLLLLLAAAWILLVTRTVSLGAIVVAPLLAQALERSITGAGPGRTGTRTSERWVVGAAALGYLLVLALAVPGAAATAEGVPTRFQPRLEALPAGSTLLVDNGTGAWVEWAVPAVHPVVDGMLDAYPVDYLRRYFGFTRAEPGWQAFVRDSGARAGILGSGSPASTALQERLGWRAVARDRDWVYLEAPDAR
ncbi:hypothetical protein KRR39_12090 [Nocardioides panacis]|uniref:Uncharacterized protein n=1 Tax=Nocardioides panacis TaxID=2849501 RepID=A0A975SV11_9ACTN|nr:hypothetical protein [Nocardioides panacis]QWZ06356.1 hypothetical protein KRR39_12090 [Nocardioides panacis]